MKAAGNGVNIDVMSVGKFLRFFFPFPDYKEGRLRRPFGSSINPITGADDNSAYIPVSYHIEKDSKDISVTDIADYIKKGKRIILTGEYGSGKSRCLKELFNILAKQAETTHTYPIAIDLRDTWGLRRAVEIIRRHFDDLGLDKGASSINKAFGSDNFCYLLDGFDEVGSQAWSDDEIKLRSIRNQSLVGLRDLISKSTAGIIICGREHYFNNNDEMFEALGLDSDSTIVIRSKAEFTDEEMEQFLGAISDNLILPEWLPKRPLICQVIANLDEEELKSIFFKSKEGDVEFWHVFIDTLCKRDAKINPAIEAIALQQVLVRLARYTRAKSSNVGPLSLNEIQRAFEEVVGQAPVDQAAMLQRLPGLGRVEAESNDRQFVDVYILDGLRALDLAQCVADPAQGFEHLIWKNPLDELGQRVLCDVIKREDAAKKFLAGASKCASLRNRVAACDIVASMLRGDATQIDFGGLAIDDGAFLCIDFSSAKPTRLRLTHCVFGSIILSDQSVNVNAVIADSLANRVYGVSHQSGLPKWITKLAVEQFESLENIAQVRRAKLTPAHQILAAILRKTFFQKGAGRKEEALLRGLGSIGSRATSHRIINVLLNEGVLTKFKGDEGYVYAPVRRYTVRITKMLAELNLSQDQIWLDCANL
jgi:hypothetical protein